MRKVLAVWLGLDLLILVALWLGGGRPEANAHPYARNGWHGDWY